MKNDGNPMTEKDELLRALGDAARAVFAEAAKNLTPKTLEMIERLVSSGQADLQIITVLTARGPGCVGALTRRDGDPIPLFKILPGPAGGPGGRVEVSH